MDVVKRTIDGLRGTIDIASTPGRGSTMTLRLPLTLAIIDGLLVRVGRGRYVIPLSAVEECVELSTEEDARSRGRSFLNIRGDLVPFLRLRELFNASMPADRYQKVVIVSAGELRVGLVVDHVLRCTLGAFFLAHPGDDTHCAFGMNIELVQQLDGLHGNHHACAVVDGARAQVP